MYKVLIGSACGAAIALSAVYFGKTYEAYAKPAFAEDVLLERDRCAKVLAEWAEWSGPDEIKSKMAFCQVEGLVSEADMKKALEAN